MTLDKLVARSFRQRFAKQTNLTHHFKTRCLKGTDEIDGSCTDACRANFWLMGCSLERPHNRHDGEPIERGRYTC